MNIVRTLAGVKRANQEFHLFELWVMVYILYFREHVPACSPLQIE